MNSSLTPIERVLLRAILDQHEDVRPLLSEQLDRITITSREPTGVGLYVTFVDQGPVADESLQRELGFDGEIHLPGVPLGLGAVLDVTRGRLNHLELFTYGEPWDGNLYDAEILPASNVRDDETDA